MDKVTALLAIKANTRLVLATELVARNTEVEALRALVSELSLYAPKTIAPRALPPGFVAAREAAMRSGRAIRVQV